MYFSSFLPMYILMKIQQLSSIIFKWEQALPKHCRMPSLGSSSGERFCISPSFSWKTKTHQLRNVLKICPDSSKVFLLECFPLTYCQNSFPHVLAAIEELRTVNPWLSGVLLLNWVTILLFFSIISHLFRKLFCILAQCSQHVHLQMLLCLGFVCQDNSLSG